MYHATDFTLANIKKYILNDKSSYNDDFATDLRLTFWPKCGVVEIWLRSASYLLYDDCEAIYIAFLRSVAYTVFHSQ